jgi:hypothetical protein
VSAPVPVLISARDRPLYLWATLDNLHRTTCHPHRFVLLDMASEDPLVPSVIAGFERRGMFDEVIRAPRNDPALLWATIWRIAESAPFFAYVEADVLIEPTEPCWLARMVALMEADPALAMLGAAIEKSDFVDPAEARRLEPDMPDAQLRALIKQDSGERRQDLAQAAGAAIFRPHSPAGRLLLLRGAALREIGAGTDYALDGLFTAAGYRTGIATGVRHRHLSLLHIYDYPDYDYGARNRYMGEMDERGRSATR